jgi:hypothetical protein
VHFFLSFYYSFILVEGESTAVLAFTREETESLVRKVDLLEGELVEVRQTHEVAEETTRGLSPVVPNAERWRERSLREDIRSSWSSSPSCRPRALSYALPLSVHHGR